MAHDQNTPDPVSEPQGLLPRPDWISAYIDGLSRAPDTTKSAYQTGLRLVIEWRLPVNNDILRDFAQRLARARYTQDWKRRGNGIGTVRTSKAKATGKPYAASTQQLYLIALRQFLGWMEANDKLPVDFSWRKAEARYKASTGKRGGARYRAKTPDDNLLAIIDHYDRMQLPGEITRTAHLRRLDILRDRALLHSLYATAGRVSEVLSLNRKDVAGGNRSRAEISGKGKKVRTIFFSAEALQAIRAYLAERDRDDAGNPNLDPYPTLFISHRKMAGNRLTAQSAWNVVKRGATAAGVTGAASPHMFRHLQATLLINAGAPMESVQKMLGHESPETTMAVYAHLRQETVESDIETFRAPVRGRAKG